MRGVADQRKPFTRGGGGSGCDGCRVDPGGAEDGAQKAHRPVQKVFHRRRHEFEGRWVVLQQKPFHRFFGPELVERGGVALL